MGKSGFKRIIGGAAALGIGLFGVYAIGAQAKGGATGDPKNMGTGALSCSDPNDNAYFAWKRTGDDIALAIGDSGVDSAGVWDITVVDQGEQSTDTVVAGRWDFSGNPDWSVLSHVILQKGRNTVLINISSAAGQTCDATWAIKI